MRKKQTLKEEPKGLTSVLRSMCLLCSTECVGRNEEKLFIDHMDYTGL